MHDDGKQSGATRAQSSITAGALAKALGLELRGDASAVLTGVASLSAAGPGCISFVVDKDETHQQAAADSRASALLVPTDFPQETAAVQLLSDKPRMDFARAIALICPRPRPTPGVHPTAVVDPSAQLGEGVSIGAHAVIGAHVVLGDDVIIHPLVSIYEGACVGARSVLHSHVVLREGVQVGEAVILQPGAIVGSDGFGYEMTGEGRWLHLPQLGTVVVEDQVELGANSCVDRAAWTRHGWAQAPRSTTWSRWDTTAQSVRTA